MSTLTLYQFELCPYCHKVKAGLELKGIPYRKVEVNPMNKRELKDLGPSPDGRKKVPVIEFKGDVVRESSDILRWLDDAHPNTPPLLPEDAGKKIKVEYDISKPTIPIKLSLDCSEAKRLFGWEPKVALDEGILKTIEWHKSNIPFN